jgi:hypothetical protein
MKKTQDSEKMNHMESYKMFFSWTLMLNIILVYTYQSQIHHLLFMHIYI